MPAVHLLIKGNVQGVFFRATARKMAETLDLKGWVRNTPEGHVEAVAEGAEHALQQFIDWCKHGPEAAKVISVDVSVTDEKKFYDFRIQRG